MSDHADIVREGLVYANNADNLYHGPDYCAALAALDALVAERDEAVEMSRQMVAAYELAGEETEAAEAERDRLIAERQRLTDENDKGVRALWDEKNKFMEALEVEMVEKKALIAERERLRDEIDADCVRIVAAEAEVARLREALETSVGCWEDDARGWRDVLSYFNAQPDADRHDAKELIAAIEQRASTVAENANVARAALGEDA